MPAAQLFAFVFLPAKRSKRVPHLHRPALAMKVGNHKSQPVVAVAFAGNEARKHRKKRTKAPSKCPDFTRNPIRIKQLRQDVR
jgi:hypothetical protein